MSEAATESATTTESAEVETAQSAGESEAAQTDATDWKAEAQKWEKRSKDNHAKATELDKQRKAAMTEAERSTSEAEERGRTAAVTEFGRELAQEKFNSLAGRRNAEFDTAKALEYVDLSKFLGDDGRPDIKAIAAAVERLVPEATEEKKTAPTFGGGARKTADKPDVSPGMGRLRSAYADTAK